MMEPGLPVGNRRPQKQALDGLLQIRGRVKGSCRSSDWTITKTKTVNRCGRCRHEPGWYGWLAGWLARSLAEVGKLWKRARAWSSTRRELQLWPVLPCPLSIT